ncbi:MAG TPA: RsmB/NOP family class I SAM-dependent RNA methyltransferase [Cyclobacteriaceae bacterium]|nr:RsmB/NOP family class I SAM-dependent RNA methyltransferase [Cyclobacteriaceae bacterium]
MKLYRNLSEAVVTTLKTIFEDNKYADKVIEKTLKQNPKWGARDRRFIAETTYDIVRWYRYLLTVSGSENDDYWSLLGTWLIWREIELPAWDQFKKLNITSVKDRFQKEYPLPIRESIPDWLDELGNRELPSQWAQEIKSLNHEAEVVLRVNTLKGDIITIQKQLTEEGIETTVNSKFQNALILNKRMNVFGSQSFKQGLFEVQDAGSQLIAPYLQVEPGMRVIDACAGAGGKTLHLSALMQNKGRIVAMDTEGWKLDELRKRAKRAGANNIEAKVIENSKTIKRLANSADRLLLDVPCSGLGVLKRNPDAKWKLSPDYISKVKILQQQILSEYATMVKPGGMLVYSTCSILPSENGEQVKQFLASNPTYELVDENHCWPSDGFDGFYMALIKKK